MNGKVKQCRYILYSNYICLYCKLCNGSCKFLSKVMTITKNQKPCHCSSKKSKEWNCMSRDMLKGGLPACWSGPLLQLLIERQLILAMLLSWIFCNNTTRLILWGFQNFLLHPFGFSNQIHWWKILTSYIYENAQVQFINSWNTDYQIYHNGI